MNYAYFLGDKFFIRGIMDTVQQQKSAGCYKQINISISFWLWERNLSYEKAVQYVRLPGTLVLIN